MKRTIKNIMIGSLVTSTILLAGCAADIDNLKQGYSTNVTGKTYPPTTIDHVVLTYVNQPDKPKICKNYKTIGQVSIETYSPFGYNYSVSELAKKLKKGGASLGADYVINISGDASFGNGTMVGYAIHCV